MNRALILMLAGGLGGVLAWLVTEPTAPKNYFDMLQWQRFESVFGLVAGTSIGLLLGGITGWLQGSRVHLLRGAAVGLVLGAVAGTAGVRLASTLYVAMVGPTMGEGSTAIRYVARSFGWAIFGSMIGVAQGASTLSAPRTLQGLVGGLLGGAIGGLGFELAAEAFGPVTTTLQNNNEGGTIPRLVGLMCVGAGIGLLIGIVEAISKQAWVRVIYGRNEGKEYLIDTARTTIGRSESATVPLFGDPNVQPFHAEIVKQGDYYFLNDAGSPVGTGVNNQRVAHVPLTSGDLIQIASFNLQFITRAGNIQRANEFRGAYVQPISGTAPPSQPANLIPTTVQPAVRPPTLVATNGPLTGQRFEVTTEMDVGREGSMIPLSFDTSVSRRHVRLTPTPSGLMLADLGSTNGTLLNGQRVQTGLANRGDRLQIGSTEFRIE